MNEAETQSGTNWPEAQRGRLGRGGRVEKYCGNTISLPVKSRPAADVSKPLIADYVLVYQGRKLAVIEAKAMSLKWAKGVAQVKNYAEALKLDTTFASNGKEIYQICMKTGGEGLIAGFPAPDELWNKTFATQNQWRDKFNPEGARLRMWGGTKSVRYYQEIAVNNTMSAIAEDKQRILLTHGDRYRKNLYCLSRLRGSCFIPAGT